MTPLYIALAVLALSFGSALIGWAACALAGQIDDDLGID